MEYSIVILEDQENEYVLVKDNKQRKITQKQDSYYTLNDQNQIETKLAKTEL